MAVMPPPRRVTARWPVPCSMIGFRRDHPFDPPPHLRRPGVADRQVEQPDTGGVDRALCRLKDRAILRAEGAVDHGLDAVGHGRVARRELTREAPEVMRAPLRLRRQDVGARRMDAVGPGLAGSVDA
nr:hypothetical protein [Sphingomonas bacterium]